MQQGRRFSSLLWGLGMLCGCLPFVSAQTSSHDVGTYAQLVKAIRQTRVESKLRTQKLVEQERVREAWEIGKLIDEHVLQHKERADYGQYVIPRLAGDLEMAVSEIYAMLEFARNYPNVCPGRALSWSHYKILLSVNDAKEREALSQEAETKKWSKHELRRQLNLRRIPRPAVKDSLTAELGTLNTYRAIKAQAGPWQGRLVLDLGFSCYHRPDGIDAFETGDIVRLEKGKLKKWNEGTLKDLYTYQASVTEIVDGDTLKAVVDLGFDFMTTQTLRMRGLDAPELTTAEGEAAKAFMTKQLATGPVFVRTVKSDKYDRYLADVFIHGEYLNQKLIEEGFAFPVSK